MRQKLQPEDAYWTIGVAAIVLGGSISAFFAKAPNTLAMWASAYLVLVVGVAQIIFTSSLHSLDTTDEAAWKWWFFGLFNLGNAAVILSSISKYSDGSEHLMITVAGSTLIVLALAIYGWNIRRAKRSFVKAYTYGLIVLLGLSSLIGIVLAGYH